MPRTRTTVIGLGNTLMGDDGIGVRVAEALQDRDLGPGVTVIVGGVAGMALVGHFLESAKVIVVDGIQVWDEPGAIYRLGVDNAGISGLRSHTSHGLSVPDLVRAARLSGANPDVVVYGIQVGDVSMRTEGLTPELQRAVSLAAQLVAEELNPIAA